MGWAVQLSKESQSLQDHPEDLEHSLAPLGCWGRHIPTALGAPTVLPQLESVSLPPLLVSDSPGGSWAQPKPINHSRKACRKHEELLLAQLIETETRTRLRADSALVSREPKPTHLSGLG